MAKLTFENDLDTILDLSKKIAVSFCRVTGRRDLRGDAENDAVLALLSVEYDPSNVGARSYLKTRALGQLIRDYQNKTGQRLKNKPQFCEYIETAARVEDRHEPTDDDATEKDALEKALQEFTTRDRAFLSDWIAGKKQIKIAADLGLTRGRISQIITRFKRKARFLKEFGGVVVVVDPARITLTDKERAAFPLFASR